MEYKSLYFSIVRGMISADFVGSLHVRFVMFRGFIGDTNIIETIETKGKFIFCLACEFTACGQISNFQNGDKTT